MLVHEEPSRYLAGDEPAAQGLLDAAATGAGR
jgi:hypothetical protein